MSNASLSPSYSSKSLFFPKKWKNASMSSCKVSSTKSPNHCNNMVTLKKVTSNTCGKSKLQVKEAHVTWRNIFGICYKQAKRKMLPHSELVAFSWLPFWEKQRFWRIRWRQRIVAPGSKCEEWLITFCSLLNSVVSSSFFVFLVCGMFLEVSLGSSRCCIRRCGSLVVEISACVGWIIVKIWSLKTECRNRLCTWSLNLFKVTSFKLTFHIDAMSTDVPPQSQIWFWSILAYLFLSLQIVSK